MKKLPRPLLSLLLLAATSVAAAFTPTEWSHRQNVPVAAPGLVKLAVPAATFDAARPGLADLRLVDAAGREVPYLLDRDPGFRLPPPEHPRPKSFRATPAGDNTQLLLETGTVQNLDALELETAAPWFLKAAHVEISADGNDWQSLGPAVPVFRQFGAEHLQLPLGRRPAAFVRVMMDDARSRPVTFTGARLVPVPVRPDPPLVAVGARITRRDEFAGETVLTVALDGGQVPLAELKLEITDPLFMRRVTVAVREVRDMVSGERTVGAGTVYRVALDGAPARARLEVPVEFSPPTRELLVHIQNGDSPPLALDGVAAQAHEVNLFFMAPAAGAFTLLTGNASATAPRYDLAAFAGEMRTAAATAVTPGDIEEMPGYRPREPLPEVPLAGAPLDAKDWTGRKPVRLARAGVQELELDPETLAAARSDFADLRLLREGNQIPYVLEQPALARSLALTPVAAPDPKRPTVSLWQLRLPQAGLPVRRIVLRSATPLFQRQIRLVEKLTGSDGRAFTRVLATEDWRRTPEPGMPETKILDLSERVQGDTLWIETDNGDNPAIALGAVQAVYPVVRLVFKAAETDGFTLAYGNQNVAAPRYDLSLVAVKLLTASRNVAQPGAGERNPGSSRNLLAGLNGGYLFWAALALVVVVLLVVVAKLLPKPPAA